MTTRTNRFLAALASLSLAACTSQTADGREVEPRMTHRTAAQAVTTAAMLDPGAADDRSVDVAAAGVSQGFVAAPHAAAEVAETAVVSDAGAGTVEPDATDAQDRATQILRRVEQAAAGVRTLQADFTQRLHVALLNQDQQSSGRLYQKRPDRFLMRFTSPSGDVMVADGQHFWIYYPSTDRKQVIRTSLAKGAGQVDLQRQFLGNASARFTAVQGADEVVGGRPAYVLTLTPRGASQFKRLKVWADKGDYLVRRFEITEQNESVRRIELRNLRVNAPVADALFRFTPPAGTQVFDQ